MVDVVAVPVEVDEGAGGVVLVYVAGEGAETFGGFDLLVRQCERRGGEESGKGRRTTTTDPRTGYFAQSDGVILFGTRFPV